MVQKIVRVESNGLGGSLQKKVDEMILERNKQGFRLISMTHISAEEKVYDFDGTPYGKNEQMEMLFEGEREYKKPEVLARHGFPINMPISLPCNPPKPGGQVWR